METPRCPLDSSIEKGERRVFLKFPQGSVELFPGTKIEPGETIFIRGKEYLATSILSGNSEDHGKPVPYDLIFAFDLKSKSEAVRATIAGSLGIASVNHDPQNLKRPERADPLRRLFRDFGSHGIWARNGGLIRGIRKPGIQSLL
jgi:hypothetical protein